MWYKSQESRRFFIIDEHNCPRAEKEGVTAEKKVKKEEVVVGIKEKGFKEEKEAKSKLIKAEAGTEEMSMQKVKVKKEEVKTMEKGPKVEKLNKAEAGNKEEVKQSCDYGYPVESDASTCSDTSGSRCETNIMI